MTEMAGCGMQIFQGKVNLLILTGGVPDSFKTDGGIKVKKKPRKLLVVNVTTRGRLSQTYWWNAGWKKATKTERLDY